jgi:hypothetical protein
MTESIDKRQVIAQLRQGVDGPKWKHGLHRPERCCLACHYELVGIPHTQLNGYIALYDLMDTEPQKFRGHEVVPRGASLDAGARRTRKARRQFTQGTGGEPW